jgi:hypothetical protein
MDHRGRREIQALCDQFREPVQRDIECALFDKEACQRIGDMISRSARQGRSEYAYNSRR